MKKIIFCLLLSVTCNLVHAQHFTFHSDSPFGIQTTSGMLSTQRLMFFDNDGDGDLDLFLSGMGPIVDLDNLTWETMPYFFDYQENIGDKAHPQFGPRETAFNGNFPFPAGFFFPSAGDLNNDGKIDFVINASVNYFGNRTPLYYKNLNHAGTDDFEQIPFLDMGLADFVPESFFIPELIDLDLDGDLDILMSGIDPAFGEEDGSDIPTYYYAKNTGTREAPQFLGWFTNPYGLIPNPLVEITTSGDIDNDGDTDILGALTAIPADSMNYIYFHNNIPGPNGKPSFTTVTQSPLGLPTSFGKNQFLSPHLVDIDSDGDLDFFVLQGTTANNVLKYYENNLCTSVLVQTGVILCQGDSIVIGGNAYFDNGSYTISLNGANGCDSLIYLTIEIIPPYSLTLNESICEGETYVIGNESFNSTGNYTVLLSTANGCDSLISLSLTVHEIFTTHVQEILCAGESYHIGNEEFSETGHFEVILSSQDGCDSLISLDLNVISLDNSLTALENTLLANQAGAFYQWFDCDSGQPIPGANLQSYDVTTTGNYNVSITDGSGCSVVSPCTNVVISGIAEDIPGDKIMLYPNPANQWISIRNDSPYPITEVQLINLSGQIIGTLQLDTHHSGDISFLENGFYFVKIKINGLEVIRKLIVL